jgi:hypothetical protein
MIVRISLPIILSKVGRRFFQPPVVEEYFQGYMSLGILLVA